MTVIKRRRLLLWIVLLLAVLVPAVVYAEENRLQVQRWLHDLRLLWAEW